MDKLERPLTKRGLGILMSGGGTLAFVAILGKELLSEEFLIGPVQGLALLACVAVALVGITLIPLGGRLA